ncbi:MAG: aldehyde dehydrogenase family protein [Ilumatobacteraceae bacterium]
MPDRQPRNGSALAGLGRLDALVAGERVFFGGDRFAVVDDRLAAAFQPGDRLVVVQATGALLHIPSAVGALVDDAVGAATRAFAELARCDDRSISAFFDEFARLLADDAAFAPIADANAGDVEAARSAGRSTTRLALTDGMRTDMVSGLLVWRDEEAGRVETVRTVEHVGWSVELRRSPLGVVGFVFEGRPNVFADACGVVRSGNTVVFRIGSDALGTARAIVEHALRPALARAGLPAGAVQLIESRERSAGHALFADRRLALAVARGSGAAVSELGAVASQAGTPVSLHGTGGAWMIAGAQADRAAFADAVRHSLDRKVCNTLNVCAIPAARADELVPVFLTALDAVATRLGTNAIVHVVGGSTATVPDGWFDPHERVERARVLLDAASLGTEWEWERSPEVSLVIVDDVDHGLDLANRYSPRFVASVITDDRAEFERCYSSLDAPFVGNGFTRWVDGQYALDRPELGLANWQDGRLLGRGAILSGDSVHTIRYVADVTDTTTHR